MSEGEIAQRVLASETPMPGEKMLRGRIAQHDLRRPRRGRRLEVAGFTGNAQHCTIPGL
jgi:hypothetical protein